MTAKTSLRCTNCKKETETSEAKFFAEVFLCPTCHEQAAHFYKKLETELHYLLTIARDAIRVSLVQGQFSLPEGPHGEPSKKEVLEEILRMEQARDRYIKESACRSTPISGGATPPHVRTLAALGSERSSKPSQPG